MQISKGLVLERNIRQTFYPVRGEGFFFMLPYERGSCSRIGKKWESFVRFENEANWG